MSEKIQKIQIETKDREWLKKSLTRTEFFSNLPADQMELFMVATHLYHYAEGQVIFKENEKGDSMYLIYQGAVSMKKKNALGLQKEMVRLDSGQVFGEMALLDSAPRTATAVASEDSQIFILTAGDFEFILLDNPQLSNRLKEIANKRKDALKKT